MWVRRRLDIAWSDLAFGLWRCFFPGENRRAAIERAWSGDAAALACLSVRTGFDLCLQALGLPKGSEILMSAVNVPAMFRLVEEHGLVPVPLDIDAGGLRPTLADVRQAITPRTRAIVVAHLFGTRADLDDIAALARERGVLLIEDHAQAFSGVPEAAPASADVALWSFGPIKAATALGGAVVTARSLRLIERMRAIESAYPVQPRIRYALRLLKRDAQGGELPVPVRCSRQGAVTGWHRHRCLAQRAGTQLRRCGASVRPPPAPAGAALGVVGSQAARLRCGGRRTSARTGLGT